MNVRKSPNTIIFWVGTNMLRITSIIVINQHDIDFIYK